MNPVKIAYQVAELDTAILEHAEMQHSTNAVVQKIKEVTNIGVDALTLISH